jgi:hypothetical protein
MNRLFKLSMGIMVFLALVVSWRYTTAQGSPAATNNYVLTNDDNTSNNTVSGLIVQKNGSLKLAGTLKTGGQGGLSYEASHKVLILNNGNCIFASDGGSGDIAAFARTSLNPPKYVLKGRFSTGDAEGPEGLAKDLNDHWLYVAYGSFQLGVWSINVDCTLGSGGTYNYLYDVPQQIGDMTALASSVALLVTYPGGGQVDSFAINLGDGSLTEQGEQASGGRAYGIIADSTATYAVTTGGNIFDVLDVWPLNEDGTLDPPTFYDFGGKTGSCNPQGITWDNGFLPAYIYVSNACAGIGRSANTVMILSWSDGVPSFQSVFTPKGSAKDAGVFSKSYGSIPTLVYLGEYPNMIGVFKQGIGTLTELPTSPDSDANGANLYSVMAYPIALNYQ